MSEQPQKSQMPERMELETLGAMPLEEALPLIMEQYQVSKRDALRLWVNNRPPSGLEDVMIFTSDEEYDRYVEESKKKSVHLFTMGGKKKTD